MYYAFDITALPEVDRVYTVYRRTVWQIVDPGTILLYAAEGCCDVTMDSAWGELSYRLAEGHILLIPAGHHYIRRPVGESFCTLYYLHLTLPGRLIPETEAFARYAREQLAGVPADTLSWSETDATKAERSRRDHSHIAALLTDVSGQKDCVLALYEQMMQDRQAYTPLSRTDACLSAAALLLLLAEEAVPRLRTEESVDSALQVTTGVKLQKVMAYIRLHRKENITLDDLCRLCNFSKQHLVRVFAAEYGTTPKAYILTYRIQCAKDLFQRYPDMSVKEVAVEMGFADQHYFSRLFTKITGMTPTAFQKHLAGFDPSKQ